MSKFDNLKIGDIIVITGLNENLFECNDENYDTLLSVMNQPCTIVDDSNFELYELIDDNKNPHEYCVERPQRAFLIKSPKLQGHDGGGKCPEYNCFWIGKDYVSFESMSFDETMDIFNKLNESDEFGWAEEIIKDAPNLVDYRTVKQGDKVVPGKDWMFGNQAQGSIYGIVDLEDYDGEPRFIEDSTGEEFWQYWVHVDWINKNGKLLFRSNYRVGPDYYDLKYYVPKPVKKKKIKESYMTDAEHFEHFNKTGKLLNGTYYFNPPLTIPEIEQLHYTFGHIKGNRIILNPTKTRFGEGQSLVWLDVNNNTITGWQNIDTVDDEDGEGEYKIESLSSIHRWCINNYCHEPFRDGRLFLEPLLDTENIFNQLNESEDDEFEWAKETVSQEYHRYEGILPYLDFDDIISFTGDFTDDYGNVLLSVEDVPFKVYKKNNIVSLKWVQPEDERPIGWSSISNSSGEVHMGSTTFEWDKELMVKILHKEEHPF
jgi:hypothetical protein